MIYKLKELGSFKNGVNFPKGSYGKGIKIVNVKDLFPSHFIDLTDLSELKENVIKNQEQYLLRQGDILFTRSSLVQSGTGMCAMVENPEEEVVYCGFIIRFRPNVEIVNPYYLTYLLRSQKYRQMFIQFAAQTTITNLNQKSLGEVEVDIPNMEEQNKIATTLKLFDDCIVINSATNDVLLQEALSLFGKEYTDSSRDIKAQEKPLYDFADYINGAAFKPDELGDEGLPVIKIAELKSGVNNTTRYFAGDKGEKYLVHNKDILFSWSGNPDTSIDLFVWSQGEGILNQHTFNVKSKYNCPWFTFLLLKSHKSVFTHIASNKQTTGLGHVTMSDLKRLTFPFSIEKMLSFEKMITPIMDLYYENMLSNHSLKEMRDTLIPRLMSGEVDLDFV